MVRLRLDLAYDGGAFYGWAKQPTLRTVQGELEQALHTILRVPADDPDEPLRLTVAGRTDTGVHALHQVCHLDVGEATLDRCVGHMGVPAPEALFRRLSRMVPDDIAIHAVSVAPEGFDARFSALERTYVYRICDDARPVDPRMRGFVLPLDDRLDLDAMNAAAAMTIGLHAFRLVRNPQSGRHHDSRGQAGPLVAHPRIPSGPGNVRLRPRRRRCGVRPAGDLRRVHRPRGRIRTRVFHDRGRRLRPQHGAFLGQRLRQGRTGQEGPELVRGEDGDPAA